MAYPLHLQTIELPLGPMRLYLPEPVALQRLYAHQKQMDPHTPFPYWARVWPAAIALAGFIQQHPQYVRQKQVLELAAGLGLPSLVAATTAHHVLCTDMAEEAMQAAWQSAALADLQNIQCLPMNWNDLDASITAHTLLLSDVNYEPSVFEQLLQVIHRFWQQGSTILLATPQRLVAGAFVAQLAPYQPTVHSMAVPHAGGHTPISLYVLAPGGSQR
jgi:predicted nicotinamide N-methyase